MGSKVESQLLVAMSVEAIRLKNVPKTNKHLINAISIFKYSGHLGILTSYILNNRVANFSSAMHKNQIMHLLVMIVVRHLKLP